jgi:lysozyme family protein
MKDNWDKSFEQILHSEGGFVNDPMDSGGMTNLGVTKAVWEAYVGHPVSEADMRALTPATVAPMYKAKYWNACKCDDLPTGLDYAVFDFAINAGVGRSAKILQTAVDVKADGAIGAITLAKVAEHTAEELLQKFSDAKIAFYKTLNNPRFEKGWLNRVAEVKTIATTMIA